MKTFKTLLFVLLLGLGLNVMAQVAINIDGSIPDSSAMLDIKSMSKGLLLPRLNTVQISGIANPAAGLLVFNTDSADFYGYNGSKWISLWNASDTLADWNCGNVITDVRDGKIYNTVLIGSQCWMSENLNIGARIDGVNNQINNSIIEKYCLDDDTVNCDTYGGLYQWDEMMQYVTSEGVQGICPLGWHMPTDDEWKTMEMYLGMSQSEADKIGWRGTDEGKKMKSTSGWYSNGNGTNSSGFTGLPGGRRNDSGLFDILVGCSGIWWSSSERSGYGTIAWDQSLNYNHDQTFRFSSSKTFGFSIRCLKN